MSRVAMGRVIKMSVGGAVGGLLGFVLLEPTLRATEQQQFVSPGGMLNGDMLAIIIQRVQHVALLGMVIGVCIGVALIVAEEVSSCRLVRLLRLSFFGVIVGSLYGLAGAFVGQICFAVFFILQMLVIGRAIGWGLMGAAAGLCPGQVARSPRRTIQGMIGGLIGGLLGGLVFDAIGQLSESGTNSRFVGFTLMGWMIGFAVGLVEEFGKEHWLTLLTGAKEGRSFIIARPNTILGRDELADIPLFGDITVQRQHAIVSKADNIITIAAAPGQSLRVNNQVTAQQTLTDGDIVHIGGHRLRFGARRISSSQSVTPQSFTPQNFTTQSVPTEISAPQILPILPSMLEVIEGPNKGQTFALLDGAIFGRDTRCEIALTRDAQTSRQHARLILYQEPDASGNINVQWMIEDGGSSNGLWFNGQRVTTAYLQTGDEIGMGQSILRIQ